MLLLASGPEGYVAPQMMHHVSQVHLVADLMVVPRSWMDEKWRRTSSCTQVHTDLTQHISHLLAQDGLSSACTRRLFHQMTPMNQQTVQEYSGVSELAHDPLWSMSDDNGPQAELIGKTWNQMKLSNQSMLPIRHPAYIRNTKSIQTLSVSLYGYGLHSLLRSNPLTYTWWHLVVV